MTFLKPKIQMISILLEIAGNCMVWWQYWNLVDIQLGRLPCRYFGMGVSLLCHWSLEFGLGCLLVPSGVRDSPGSSTY